MFRMLATDIDDTLLDPDGVLPEENRVVLRRLHEKGVIIVFCSGRADVSIHKIAATILEPADDEYLIGFNGARVVTAKTRTIVTRNYVEPSAVARVAKYAREHDLYLQGYAEDRFLAERHTEDTDRYAVATGMEFVIVSDLISALPDGAPKMLLIGDHDHLEAHVHPLYELSQARVGSSGFDTMFSKPRYLEIMHRGVSKGSALRALAGRLGVPIEQVIALGDSQNDVDMIRAAGTGVAVGNARGEAKDAADVVLTRTASDAALVEVEELFFR